MRDANNYTVSKLIKISLYAQARQLPLLQAQSSVWNRLIFLNNYLMMLLHKLNEIFHANWTWISDCRASSILKTVPASQDSKEYAKCKLGEFVHNNTKPLFRIAWHFWTNTKYSGGVLLIISVNIHGSWLSVWELEYFYKVSNTLRFHSMPKLNSRFYLSPKAVFTIVWDS